MKYYYELTKSGLVFGNVVAVIAGFLLGTAIYGFGAQSVDIRVLIATIVGIAFVMASGCVFNNYVDRDIDARMERTKGRALVKGKVSGRNALIFATILGAGGFAILGMFANLLAMAVAIVGFIFYVGVYTLWAKRRSVHGTFAGAIAGATPPLVGYAAATAHLDLAAAILFLIMLVWQMPHFFAIAIRRQDDYAAANVPVMPVAQGVERTKTSMLIYIVEFIAAAAALFVFGYTGPVYLAIALALGIVWFILGLRGLRISGKAENIQWARQMFFFSLLVMVAVFGTIAIGAIV